MDTFTGSLLLIALFGAPLFLTARLMRAGYKRDSLALRLTAFLLAPLLFSIISSTLFMTAAGRATTVGTYVCGAAGGLALLVILAGSILEIAAALVLWELVAGYTRRS